MDVSRHMETILQEDGSSIFVERKKTLVLGEEAQQTQRPSMSPWRYLREVCEATVALSIVVIGGLCLPSTLLQSHLVFCALFLIIFFIASRSHAVTTYTVCFLIAGCYGFLLWQLSPINLSFDMLPSFVEPFLLFVSGIAINEMLRARRYYVARDVQQHVREANALQQMKQRYQAVQACNAELEQQLVAQSVSVSTICEKLAGLWKLQGREQYNAILDIVMHAVNAKCCALYVLRNGNMSLCANKTEDDSKHAPTVRLNLDESDALIRRTIQSRKICTIRDTLIDNQSTPRVVAVMAGPLVDRHNRIRGVVVVDDIPLLKFLPTTVRLFDALLRIISIAVIPAKGE